MWSTLGSALQPLLAAVSAIPGVKKAPKPCIPPWPFPAQPDTPAQDLDAALSELRDAAPGWVAQSCEQRVALLHEVQSRLLEAAPRLASDVAQAKGSYGCGSGEELAALLAVSLHVSEYCDTLRAEGAPQPMGWRTRVDGQQVAQVFPRGMLGLLFAGFKGEVWIQPGEQPSQGQLYREKVQGRVPKPKGAVSLVLGAGNHANLVLCDVLHKLLVEDEVVLLKLNPVNDFIGRHVEFILQPLVSAAWLRIAYGGPQVGKALIQHPGVDSIHLTGSADTYNSIVWGSPTAPRTGKPLLNKPISAELGSVTPCIVVPPPKGTQWTQEQMRVQAHNVAAGLLHNCGHNCLGLEVLVTAADWPQRTAFLSTLREVLNASPRRCLWYPGSRTRQADFRKAFGPAEAQGRLHVLGKSWGESVGGGVDGSVEGGQDGPDPVLLVEGLKPEEVQGQRETWGTCLQEVAIPGTGDDVGAFLTASADFVNTKLWGTLACSVLAHPASMAAVGDAALDAFVASLRYGSIVINAPSIIPFALSSLSWGAFPGHTPTNIGSGVGAVHNTLMFDHPQKSVLWAPWVYRPTPFWWTSHRNLEPVSAAAMRTIAAGAASGSWLGVGGTLWVLWLVVLTALHAVRG